MRWHTIFPMVTGLSTRKSGFMIAPSLTYTNKRTKKKVTNDYILKEVLKAEKKICRSGCQGYDWESNS